MKTAYRITITIIITLLSTACLSSKHVLPVADGGGPKPSPPSLIGRIVSVAPDEIVVEKKLETGEPLSKFTIRVTEKTKIFTVYGGYVGPNELSVGQRVKIWNTTPKPIKNGQPTVAAVIMLASTNPNDDWP
jgi:hypothetical protein